MTARPGIRERLSSQNALVGLLQSHPSPVMTELAGICGYDFVLMDDEHGVFSEQDFLHAFQALSGTRTLSAVRLRKHDTQALGRYLDMGAEVIVVPNVSNADQARALARAMAYPPAGTRGFGAPLHRATRYGIDLETHLKNPREGVSLLVIIESAAGVANADDILAVDGIDGVIIGPYDLSADLGFPGDFTQPAYGQAVARIEAAARDRGKVYGTAPHPGSPLEVLLARGHRLFIVNDDVSIVREAMSAQVREVRAVVEERKESTL